jgi:hypothetical protein
MLNVSVIIMITVGIVQYIAMLCGISEMNAFLIPFCIILGWIPFIGTILGIYGAVVAWHMSYLSAFALFLLPTLFAFLIAFINA